MQLRKQLQNDQLQKETAGVPSPSSDDQLVILGLLPLASHHKMLLQRRSRGDVQNYHGTGLGETPPQLGDGEDLKRCILVEVTAQC